MARTVIGVKVNDNERAIVMRLAAEQERTVSDVVRRLIRQADPKSERAPAHQRDGALSTSGS